MILIGAVVGIWLSSQLSLPVITNQQVGTNGGITLEFSAEMQRDSVAQRLSISHTQNFQLVWQGRAVTIWPNSNWKPGSMISVHLASGAESLNGREIPRDFNSQIIVRQPELIYLSSRSGKDQIWKSTLTGETETLSEQTEVLETAVSRDGEWIAFSLNNNQGGADLWIMDRNGEEQRMLVECGNSVCSEISWQPFQQKFAYSRYLNGLQGIPRVWTVDVQTGEIFSFFEDEEIIGHYPAFSPNGSALSIFSPVLGGIYLQDLQKGASSVIQTSIPQQAVWSPDGQVVYFLRGIGLEGQPVDKIYRFDLKNNEISIAQGFEDDLFNYGTPAWSPDGSIVAIPLRQMDGGLSTQIWLFDKDGVLIEEITNDPVYIHGGLAWSGDGSQLRIQRLAIDSSQQQSDILVWNAYNGENSLIVEGAFGGDWLP